MNKALPIMLQGTHSDAGKSVITTAFCRIFAQDGFKTAPFKSQNMALNSYITIDGKEIGRAQGVQAEAAGIAATTDMNPILIKPSRDYESQIVVHGKVFETMKAGDYRKDFFKMGVKLIQESLQVLSEGYERIVIEGAGSPAEINLMDRELVNMRVARIANAPVILIGDIDKGGVFASLVGTLQLLNPEDRERVIGVIINKFRGDVSLLQPGLDWFEEYTGKKVLGVVPYIRNLAIDAEDSLVLNQYTSDKHVEKEIDIVVIQYPRISNFTDAEPFFAEPDCDVRYVTRADQVHEPDLILLPGSKNTIEDLMFLQESGIAEKLLDLHKKKKSCIFGICGGYQMLGEKIFDPLRVESPYEKIEGLGLLPVRTVMTEEKTTVLSKGQASFAQQGFAVTGYEIHMGETIALDNHTFIQTEGGVDGCKSEDERVVGTYFHGIFHNDALRETVLNTIRQHKGLDPINQRVTFNELREAEYDRVAEHVRKHVDFAFINKKMEEFQTKEIAK
ncbi:cobyric acid synthase [Ectobacillus sp. sgz5001026]|uniref:cobyric acid synthase n=1 Tax=Ectobacillus sp. sgz5001026 TaxID=3242473 RepID=UPI0036D260DE